MVKLKQTWEVLKEAGGSWSQDRAPSMGAALSYYSMFSIAPLLVIVISVAGMFFGEDAVRGAVFAQIGGLMGQPAAEAIQEMLRHASRPEKGGLTAIVSTVVLLFGASTVLAELQGALDRIWRVPERVKENEKKNGLWVWIRTRLLTFGMVLALAFLLMVSLVMSAAVATMGKWWGDAVGESLAHALDLGISFGLLMVVFAMIYKLMPRAKIKWRDVWVGAAVTALLFVVGKFLIGLYLGKSDVSSSFGAFGSIALVMIWVYYSSQIFLFGSEFTWVYAHRFGSRRGEPRPASLEKVEDAAAEAKTLAPPQPRPAPRPPKSFSARHPPLVLGGALILGAALRVLLQRLKPRAVRTRRLFS
jgi:membrane protein